MNTNDFLRNTIFNSIVRCRDVLSDINNGGLYTPTAWSPDMVIDHITLTNKFLLITVNNKFVPKILKIGKIRNSDRDYSDSFDRIHSIKDSDNGWINPSHHFPSGCISLTDIDATLLNQLNNIYSILDTVSNLDVDVTRITMSVNNLGKLDLYDWLYFLNCHMIRHLDILSKRRIS